MLTTIRRNTVAIAAAAVVSLGAIAAPAPAAVIHQQIEPVYTATPCKHDTSPSYPSCGTSEMVAIKVPEPWLAVAPCKHDDTLTPEQCYPRPR